MIVFFKKKTNKIIIEYYRIVTVIDISEYNNISLYIIILAILIAIIY